MENIEVIERLVEINEKVKSLQENPGAHTIGALIKYIVGSQKLMLQYKLTSEHQERVARAILKMIKVEEMAREYAREYDGALSSFDLEVVFEAYQEAFEKFFD